MDARELETYVDGVLEDKRNIGKKPWNTEYHSLSDLKFALHTIT